MSDNDLFTSEKPVDTPTVEPTPVDQEKNYLEELVGEDKKFKSVEDLARSKAEADMFIERLKAENQGIRDELKTRTTLEDFMDKMNSQQQPQETQPNTQTTTPAETAPEQKTISSEDIETLVEAKLTAREKELRAEQNLELVKNKLSTHWGDSYTVELKKKAAELGLGENFLNDLAKQEPKAFVALMGLEGEPKQQAAPDIFNSYTGIPTTQQNTAAVQSQPKVGVKNKAYYDNIKKTDPNRYWSSAVQNELHKEAQSQGVDFFNN